MFGISNPAAWSCLNSLDNQDVPRMCSMGSRAQKISRVELEPELPKVNNTVSWTNSKKMSSLQTRAGWTEVQSWICCCCLRKTDLVSPPTPLVNSNVCARNTSFTKERRLLQSLDGSRAALFPRAFNAACHARDVGNNRARKSVHTDRVGWFMRWKHFPKTGKIFNVLPAVVWTIRDTSFSGPEQPWSSNCRVHVTL